MMASAASQSAVDDAKLPSKKVITDLLKVHENKQKDMDSLRAEIGSATSLASEKHNLNKKAFGLIKQLRKMSGSKLADFKAHFDLYWEHAGMDALMEDALPMQDDNDPAAGKRNVGKMAAAEQGDGSNDDGPRPSPFRATVEVGDKTIKEAAAKGKNGKEPKTSTAKPKKDKKPVDEPGSNIRRLPTPTPRA